MNDRYRGALVGLAAGDAVGTTVEFSPRGSFAPLTDVVGGGPFGLQPGQWTDDTSMALCLAVSLVECRGFETAILMAANLGDDADTTAAVCGQIAGAFYGEAGIPPSWLAKPAQLDTLRRTADQLRQGQCREGIR